MPLTFPGSDAQTALVPMKDGDTYLYRRRGSLYPFGCGLSYSRFIYSCLRLSETRIPADTGVSLSCRLENQGPHAGHEVAQVYVRRDTRSEPGQPRWSLCSASRVFLGADESREVCFTLPSKIFAAPGRYIVYMGGHQPDARSVFLAETPVLSDFVTVE
jgi:beta-glucosidase